MKATCIRKCYWRETVWNPGDEVVLGPDEKIDPSVGDCFAIEAPAKIKAEKAKKGKDDEF